VVCASLSENFYVGEELWREHEREIKVMRKGLKEPEILARIF
jgi:hypothetical protein